MNTAVAVDRVSKIYPRVPVVNNLSMELGSIEGFRQRYDEAIAALQQSDRLNHQFLANSTAANHYLESLTDKTEVMVRDSNLEDIFVRLTGHQLN